MTTPEQMRRRQRVEGVALAILGVATVVLAIQDSRQEGEQRACLASVVSQQNDVLISGRTANNIEQAADRALITAALAGRLRTPEALEEAKADYAQAAKDAKAERDSSPVPPDPEKVCQ